MALDVKLDRRCGCGLMLQPEEIEELTHQGYTFTVDSTANEGSLDATTRYSRRFKSTHRVVRFFETKPKKIVIFEVLQTSPKIHMAP